MKGLKFYQDLPYRSLSLPYSGNDQKKMPDMENETLHFLIRAPPDVKFRFFPPRTKAKSHLRAIERVKRDIDPGNYQEELP
jgi:hypothetical protein